MEDRTGLVTPEDPRTHKERMLAGDWFWGPDPELLAEQIGMTGPVAEYVATLARGAEWPEIAAALKRVFDAADMVFVKPPFIVEFGYRTAIGERSFVNSGATFLDAGGITLGRSVLLGPNVQLLTSYHPLEASERRKQLVHARPIVIEDEAWIGGGATILAGVTIGTQAIVGAASVVTKDVPPRTLVVGNPARVVRELAPDEDPAVAAVGV
jgi:maltose O-acetyltransferase